MCNTTDEKRKNSFLNKAVGYMTLRELRKGQVIFHERDSQDMFYIIVEGEVDFYKDKSHKILNAERFKLNNLAKFQSSFGKLQVRR